MNCKSSLQDHMLFNAKYYAILRKIIDRNCIKEYNEETKALSKT